MLRQILHDVHMNRFIPQSNVRSPQILQEQDDAYRQETCQACPIGATSDNRIRNGESRNPRNHVIIPDGGSYSGSCVGDGPSAVASSSARPVTIAGEI